MKPSEYLDALRKALDLPSDYALAAHFKVTRAYISTMRRKEIPLPHDMAMRAAKLLDMHPGFVMLDMEKARAKTPEEANIWQEISAGFPALLLHAKSVKALRPTR